ncbi:MAG: TRAP transporter large permease subunit, partial [Nitrososphaerota archaeon]
ILPTTACYILSAALFAPPLIAGGFDPLAVHLFIYYFAMMAPLTPPVAIPVFVACSIAERAGYKTDFWKAMWYGTAFGALGYIIPFVFMFDPSLLILGAEPGLKLGYDVVQILARTFFTGFATLLLVATIFGFYVKPLNIFGRIITGVASALLYIPDLTYTWNFIGCAVGLATYLYLKIVAKPKLITRIPAS